jgi:hypothetical protein
VTGVKQFEISLNGDEMSLTTEPKMSLDRPSAVDLKERLLGASMQEEDLHRELQKISFASFVFHLRGERKKFLDIFSGARNTTYQLPKSGC